MRPEGVARIGKIVIEVQDAGVHTRHRTAPVATEAAYKFMIGKVVFPASAYS